MPRSLVIDVSKSLPLRTRPIGGAELAEVFGGCAQRGYRCQVAADCCGNDECRFDTATEWKCVEAGHGSSGGWFLGSGGNGGAG